MRCGALQSWEMLRSGTLQNDKCLSGSSDRKMTIGHRSIIICAHGLLYVFYALHVLYALYVPKNRLSEHEGGTGGVIFTQGWPWDIYRRRRHLPRYVESGRTKLRGGLGESG